MYPEFIVMYIGIAILLVLNVIILVFLLKIKSEGIKSSNSSAGNSGNAGMGQQMISCKRCSALFNPALGICPRCGTPK